MSSEQTIQENKMGVMPINKLLISMSLPLMVSMLIKALYNIVDSIFVAKINANALTAVSLSFPVHYLMIAVSAGTGVGINALLSRSLGAKNTKDANDAANNGIFLALLSYLIFMLFGIFFTRQFYLIQTSGIADSTQRAEIIQYGVDYLSICTIFSFGVFMQVTFERLLQSTGQTLMSMLTQGIGAIINIILDPILIFGYFGFPKLGVSGAAIATIIGQVAAMVLGILLNFYKNKELHLNFRGFRPNRRIIKIIYKVGLPAMIMQSILSVLTLCLNQILQPLSTVAVNVLGIYFKLQSFFFMPVIGLNNGMIPIIAYNYGAKKPKRIIRTIRLSIMSGIVIMLIGFIVFQLLPKQLLSLFSTKDELDTLIQYGVPALRIISLSFLFAGFCIIMAAVFQAFGNGMYSLLISVTRQLVIILPFSYLFSRIWGVNGVWFAFPLAEFFSVILCIVMFKKTYRQNIAPLHKT